MVSSPPISLFFYLTLILSITSRTSFSARLDIPNMKPDMKVAFFGDNLRDDFNSPYELMEFVADEQPDMIVVLGDVGYRNQAAMWCELLNDYVSTRTTVFAVPGESAKEMDQWFYPERDPGAISYVDCLKNFSPDAYRDNCEGDEGVMQVCVHNGLLLLLMGYDLAYSDDSGRKPFGYDNDDYLEWAETKLQEYADVPWKACCWHFAKGKYTISGPADGGRTDMLDLCRQYGAIVLGGNSHTYSRTHVMDDFYDELIADDSLGESNSRPITIRPGQSISIVSGLGGATRPNWDHQKANRPYWARYGAKDNNLGYGALFCNFNYNGDRDVTRCDFKEMDNPRDSFDTFYMISDTSPLRVDPDSDDGDVEVRFRIRNHRQSEWSSRKSFESFFSQRLGKVLNVYHGRVKVRDLKDGSIVIAFDLIARSADQLDEKTATNAYSELMEQSKDENSVLRKDSFFKDLDADSIVCLSCGGTIAEDSEIDWWVWLIVAIVILATVLICAGVYIHRTKRKERKMFHNNSRGIPKGLEGGPSYDNASFGGLSSRPSLLSVSSADVSAAANPMSYGSHPSTTNSRPVSRPSAPSFAHASIQSRAQLSCPNSPPNSLPRSPPQSPPQSPHRCVSRSPPRSQPMVPISPPHALPRLPERTPVRSLQQGGAGLPLYSSSHT